MKIKKQILDLIIIIIIYTVNIFANNKLLAQCPPLIRVNIDTVFTAESRCQASGTATVIASYGTPPLTYSIISGPVTAPPQSANIFQSLSPGNYLVQVTDNCNQPSVKNFSIFGTYTILDFATTSTPPYCHGGVDGRIKVTATNGRPPFTYSLISPSPITVAPQASNVFNNLLPGTYTCRVTDSCGNFQTRTSTVTDNSSNGFTLGFSSYDLKLVECDSFAIPYQVIPQNYSAYRMPYTITFIKPNGSTIIHVLDSSKLILNQLKDTFRFRYHHVTGATDTYSLNGINSCSATIVSSGNMRVLDLSISASLITNGCSNSQYVYTFDYAADNNVSNGGIYQLHCDTIYYSLVNSSGQTLVTQINNSTFAGYPSGLNYKVVREDCCSRDSILFYWQISPTTNFGINNYNLTPSSKEGTATLNISFTKQTKGSLVFASGPSLITFSNGQTLIPVYPDTIKNIQFGVNFIAINYFVTGTYKIFAIDTCGQKDSITIVVHPSDLRHSSFNAYGIKGCINKNKIIWNTTSNGNGFVALFGYYNGVNVYNNSSSNYSGSAIDSFINLPGATFSIWYVYSDAVSIFLKGMSTIAHDVIKDTLIISPYTQPMFMAIPAITVCNGVRNVVLLADSNSGVIPFSYQIISGPHSTALQASPVFTNLTVGTYPFLMSDACGNSYSSSLSVDTLIVPAIATIGSTCENGNATLVAPASPYYSYSWQHPDGAISPGNSVTINPVTVFDTGTYKLSVICNINGCVNSTFEYFNLRFCTIVPLKFVSFNAKFLFGSVILKWETANEINSSYFVVEKSNNGIDFFAINKINANGQIFNYYTVTDKDPFNGRSYYRVKQVDTDGNISFSTIVLIQTKGGDDAFINPNPVRDILILHWNSSKRCMTTIKILDVTGKILLSNNIMSIAGMNTLPLSVQSLSAGTYIMRLQKIDKLQSFKFIKE